MAIDNLQEKPSNEAQNRLSLPFKVKSIQVKNTGFYDVEVEGVVWIDEKLIEIVNSVDCVFDDLHGGTTVGSNTEFEWSFIELDISHDAYVLITLNEY